MKTRKNSLKEKTKRLLEKPGVYVMYDDNGHKLYIGKSVNIKQRVASYWSKSGERSKKIKRMIYLVDNFQIYYTETELDALLLESSWIEQFKPPYNTALTRQDKEIYFDIYKAHPYSIKISRAKKTRAYKRYGPFANRRLVMKAYYYITQNYPYFFCEYDKKKLNTAQCQSIMKHRCEGVCETRKEGLEELFIKTIFGNTEVLNQKLEEKIQKLSDAWEFEKAAEVLEQMKGLNYIRTMHKWLEEARTQSYIGRLAITDTCKFKYYLISQGRIVHSKVGYRFEEAKVIGYLRKYYKTYRNTSRDWKHEGISSYQLLITNSFKNNKMKLFEV